MTSAASVEGGRTALQPGLLQQIFSQAGQPTQRSPSHQSPHPTLPYQSRPYTETSGERKPARECHNQIGDFDSLAIGKWVPTAALTPRDLVIRDSWGIDSYTRHLIQMILDSLSYRGAIVDAFIQRCLFPALSALPSNRASDMRCVSSELLRRSNALVFLIAHQIALPLACAVLQAVGAVESS